MAKNPDMKHEDDPSAVHLAPGETEEVIPLVAEASLTPV